MSTEHNRCMLQLLLKTAAAPAFGRLALKAKSDERVRPLKGLTRERASQGHSDASVVLCLCRLEAVQRTSHKQGVSQQVIGLVCDLCDF